MASGGRALIQLWRLLGEEPTSSAGGPLRQLLELVGQRADGLRESIERMLEDTFVETSDDWAVPYIGTLTAVAVGAGTVIWVCRRRRRRATKART